MWEHIKWDFGLMWPLAAIKCFRIESESVVNFPSPTISFHTTTNNCRADLIAAGDTDYKTCVYIDKLLSS